MTNETIVTITEDDVEYFRQRMLNETNHKARKKYEKQYQVLLNAINSNQEIKDLQDSYNML